MIIDDTTRLDDLDDRQTHLLIQDLTFALYEVLDGLGAMTSPHELVGHGMTDSRATEIVLICERARSLGEWC